MDFNLQYKKYKIFESVIKKAKLKYLYEEDFVPGGAYPTCGVYGPYQTLTNTVGISDPVSVGGSDRYDNTVFKPAVKKDASYIKSKQKYKKKNNLKSNN